MFANLCLSLLLIFGIITLVTACKKMVEEPVAPQRDKRVTTLIFTMIQPNADTVILSYQDIDGNGGDPAMIQGDTIKANNVYFATIEVFDERENPIENITEEIEASPTDYQFFFRPTGVNLTVNYADTDDNNLPIGLFTANIAGEPSDGNLLITLQQKPDKLGPGVAQGVIDNAAGFTEIQVNLPIVIQ